MKQFIDKHGWSVIKDFPQDGSARSYARVEKDKKTAILMYCPDPEAAGNRISDFMAIGKLLADLGLNTPDIYEHDGNFLLIEDFGDVSFKAIINQGENVAKIYNLAHDVLQNLNAQNSSLDLPDFYKSGVYHGRKFLVDWYLPLMNTKSDNLMKSYLGAWDEIESNLPPSPQTLLHIDYHLENLMWLSQEQGIKRCGILDFQGAMIGPKAYDLGNLLEDARADVPSEIKDKILAHYDEEFRAQYRVYTTLFHCRLMGQFIKMAAEDGKDQYLQYLPRVSNYIAGALEHPILKPLDRFFNDLKLDFRDVKRLNADAIEYYITETK